MKKRNVLFFIIVSFLIGTQAYKIKNIDLAGPTKEVRIENFSHYNIEPSSVSFSGIDPKTKLEFNYETSCLLDIDIEKPIKIYHDIESGKISWATYKYNNLWVWDVEIHIP